MNDQRLYQFTLTDLIDTLTIDQIKEVLLPETQRTGYAQEMEKLARDVNLLLSERGLKPTGRIVRLITLLAQANLHVWHHKDQMQTEADYYTLLEKAQDLNGIRNHVRNLLMDAFNEGTPANRKATFLDYAGDRWYSTVINALGRPEQEKKGSHTPTLTLDDFARLFGTTADDIPTESREVISTKNFSYKTLDPTTRDRVVASILQRIDSDELWVSGPHRQDIWEKGWAEALQEYERTSDFTTLTPKFIRPYRIVRLNRDYVMPEDPDFEFNVVDVYRRWAFRKYLKDVQAIHEFGCGSCQHIPVLTNLFPGIEIHGLDWAVASIEIVTRLAAKTGWNITGHIFNLYLPDDQLSLDSHCGVFTVGTMEQLGQDFEPFLQFLLRKRPAIVLHMETIRELYDPTYLTDYLAIRYDQKRNYLNGYLDRLRQLEHEGRIQLLNVQRIAFGSMFHDSYSLVVWRPK